MKEFLTNNIYYSVFASLLLGVVAGFLMSHFQLIDLSKGYKEINGDIKNISENKDVVSEKSLESSCDLQVDVSGAVSTPGVYCFTKGSLYIDAINRANGFTRNFAKEYVARNVNLATVLEENGKIYIPFSKDLRCEFIDFDPKATLEDILGGVIIDNKNCVSINTATLAQLEELSGVGESTAIKIIDGRPYKKLEDLKNISGIGDKSYEDLVSQICL